MIGIESYFYKICLHKFDRMVQNFFLMIESLLKENTQNFELIHTLQENLVTTVNNLNATLNKLNDTFHENNLIIDQKLDNICTLIKNNNIATQQHLTNGNQTNNVFHTKENIN